MAEKSFFWTTNGVGDGPSAGYDRTDLANVARVLGAGNSSGGIVPYLNEYVYTIGTGKVTVGTGACISDGKIHLNDAALDVTIPTPSTSTRIDRIVVRTDWSAQTCRIVRLAGTEGGGAPSLTQTSGTTWETPLYQVTITTGAVITVSSDDRFATSTIIARQGGSTTDWDTVGTTNHYPQNPRIQVGVREWTGTAAASGSVSVTLPKTMSYKPIVQLTYIGGTPNVNLSVSGITTSGFTINWAVSSGTLTSVPVHWLVIGQR